MLFNIPDSGQSPFLYQFWCFKASLVECRGCSACQLSKMRPIRTKMLMNRNTSKRGVEGLISLLLRGRLVKLKGRR